MAAKLPRGIRNNNPGNIEWGDPWQGLDDSAKAKTQDPRFAVFKDQAMGIRAIARTLITYQDKHGIKTIEDAINRWAPPVENDTVSYSTHVAKLAGVAPNQIVDFQNYKILRAITEGIIRHENGDPNRYGRTPKDNANEWYDDKVINEAMKLAGIKDVPTEVAAMPVTKETVGATVAAGTGVVQLADVAPAVATAISQSEDNLTSGDWVRIIFAIVTIGAAAYIAWSQLKKHRQGTL